MKTIENNPIPPEFAVEMQEAVEHVVRGVRDPERINRARRRMDRIREEIRQEHGVPDIGVAAIRELRYE
jgi:hypothetical protein